MKITYYAHSSFKVEATDGTRVIIDPYEAGSYDGAVAYAPIHEPADVVVASHDHPDHYGTNDIPGDPPIFVHPVSQRVGGMSISGIETAHDEVGGEKRGRNTVTILDDGDVRLVHLGDLGHQLDESAIEAIGRVDVLLIPVGGFFTIDQNEAAQVVDSLNPRIVVPMHYKTEKIDFAIAPVAGFLKTQRKVLRPESSVLEVTAATLPAERETIVLPRSR
jgi:L-ascorbate metabolism protein UlaG (beta-lactamase superfamily)